MKKIIHFLVVCLFTLQASFAQNTGSSLLWEVSGNGLASPSYVFGTIHMICKEDFFMPAAVQQAVERSQAIYLELKIDDPGLQMQMLQLLRLENGQNLQQIFGKEGYALLDSFFRARLNMSLSFFSGFKPFMALSLMYQKMLPCAVQQSYEMEFAGLARKYKKEIRGLETVADQVAVFDAIPDSVEAASILKMVQEFEAQQTELNKMVQLYRSQDVEALYQLSVRSEDMMGSAALLLENRNRKWIAPMEKAMQEGTTFFAVGAAHLGGPAGVLQLLREKGYSVKPVPLQ